MFVCRWVCDDLPEMKAALENNILCDFDTRSFDSMKALCDRFNRAVDSIVALVSNCLAYSNIHYTMLALLIKQVSAHSSIKHRCQ